MKEEKAVAILMANLKGSKNKPTNLITLAEASAVLLNHPKWGLAEMRNYFSVSEYMIRQITHINDLDIKLKKIVQKNKLGIESAYHIWRIQNSTNRTLSDAIKAANLMKDMISEEIRVFMHYFLRNNDLTVEQCKELADNDKPKTMKIVAIPLNEYQFTEIMEKAKLKKEHISKYMLNVVLEVVGI